MGLKFKRLVKSVGKVATAVVKAPAGALNAVGQSGILGMRHDNFRVAGIRIGKDLAGPLQAAAVVAATVVGGPAAGAAASTTLTGLNGGSTGDMLRTLAIAQATTTVGGVAQAMPNAVAGAAVQAAGAAALADVQDQNVGCAVLGSLAGSATGHVVDTKLLSTSDFIAQSPAPIVEFTKEYARSTIPVITRDLVTKNISPQTFTNALVQTSLQTALKPPADTPSCDDAKPSHAQQVVQTATILDETLQQNDPVDNWNRNMNKYNINSNSNTDRSSTSATSTLNVQDSADNVNNVELTLNSKGPTSMSVNGNVIYKNGIGVKSALCTGSTTSTASTTHSVGNTDIYKKGVALVKDTTITQRFPKTNSNVNSNSNHETQPIKIKTNENVLSTQNVGSCIATRTTTNIEVANDSHDSAYYHASTRLRAETHFNAECVGDGLIGTSALGSVPNLNTISAPLNPAVVGAAILGGALIVGTEGLAAPIVVPAITAVAVGSS